MSNAIKTIDNEMICFIIYCLNCVRHGRNATYKRGLIDKSVKGYLSKVTTTGKDASKCETSNCHFYKLPYIGYYSSWDVGVLDIDGGH